MRKLYPAFIAITLALPAAYADETIRLFGKQIPLPPSRATRFHGKTQKQSRATQPTTRHPTREYQEAPAKPNLQAVKHALHWKLTNGPLSEALRQKLTKTNHHLIWKPGIDYRITVPIDIQAPSLHQALDQVSRLYGLPMSICNGNRTIVVYPAGTPTSYMRCGAATPITINDAHESNRPTTQIRSAIRKAGESIWTIEDRGTF